MAELSLFEPQILRELVKKFPIKPQHVLFSKVPKTTSPTPFFEWEIIRRSHQMAGFNVPNAEAHINAPEGFERQQASLAYVREKVVWQPTTLNWLRQLGTLSDVAPAEVAVRRDLEMVSDKIDNRWEWALWQALQGSVTISQPDVGTTTVDYRFAASHKPTASTLWSAATPQQIIANVNAWKEIVRQDSGGVDPNVVYVSTKVLTMLTDAFVNNTAFLSDSMRNEYYATGTLKGFLGMNWTVNDSYYQVKQSDGSLVNQRFLPENKAIFANLDVNQPMEFVRGPSADHDAPQGYIGRFTKSWLEPDPSYRQALIEEHGLPIITRPEQILVATVGS